MHADSPPNHYSDGVLADRTNKLIVKPCDQAEIRFYESTTAHPDFKYFTPKFFGTLSLGAPDVTVPAPTAEASETSSNGEPVLQSARKSWIPSGGGKIKTDCAIVLENVASGFKNPNILDVKLGAQLWGDDAPPAKRAKLDIVAEQSTSKPLGFRCAGAKMWLGAEVAASDGPELKGYRKYDKHWGRELTVETVKGAFADFFLIKGSGMSKALARRVVRRFAADLRDLQKTLEKEESRMYSASLLFVYEGNAEALKRAFEMEKKLKDGVTRGDESGNEAGTFAETLDEGAEVREEERELPETEPDSEDEELALPKIQAVKLIDFAHAQWTPGQGLDENMLHGVRNVIKILEDLGEEFKE